MNSSRSYEVVNEIPKREIVFHVGDIAKVAQKADSAVGAVVGSLLKSWLEDFVAAVEETVYQNVDTHNHAADWRNRFLDGYRAFYGKELVVPRWHEVKGKYVLPKKGK